MKKFLVIFVGLLGFSSGLMAVRLAEQPEFEDRYIKMSARIGLCGGVTLVPKGNAKVMVKSRRFSQGLFGEGVKPGPVLSRWISLLPGGLRVRYDWAGPRPSYHYRIYCIAQNERGVMEPVSCKEVVELEDVQNNRACISGPLGPSARYAPLNMRREPAAEEVVEEFVEAG